MNPLYAKIKFHYPGQSDMWRTDKMKLGRGTLNRIKSGEIPGLRAAKWMADHFPDDCAGLYQEVLAQNAVKKMAGGKKSAETRADYKKNFIIPQPIYPSPHPQPECAG